MECAESIADYQESVGALRDYIKAHAGAEPGDPGKAAKVVIDVADMKNPPLHLPLGNDALLILRRLYEDNLKELDRWSHLATSTDFDGVAALTKEHKIPSVWEDA